jgi:hypothetical protein
VLRGLGTVAAIVAVALASAAAPSAAPAPPRVTVIGDSVLTSILWYPTPRAILGQGIDLNMQVAVCRRLTGVSCPFQGTTAPTLVDLVPTLGSSIGKTVVVEMGYNDFQATFAQSLEQAIQVLLRAGVQHILWATLRAARHSDLAMDQMLETASYRHPQLTLVDWNTYSRSHPDWFQNDGIHLFEPGGEAFATLLHTALVQVLNAPLQPALTALPPAHVGRRYDTHLAVQKGTGPYRWKLVHGGLPQGLRLSRDGEIAGRPIRATSRDLEFRVTDARGHSATRRGLLAVDGPSSGS